MLKMDDFMSFLTSQLFGFDLVHADIGSPCLSLWRVVHFRLTRVCICHDACSVTLHCQRLTIQVFTLPVLCPFFCTFKVDYISYL